MCPIPNSDELNEEPSIKLHVIRVVNTCFIHIAYLQHTCTNVSRNLTVFSVCILGISFAQIEFHLCVLSPQDIGYSLKCIFYVIFLCQVEPPPLSFFVFTYISSPSIFIFIKQLFPLSLHYLLFLRI